MMTRKAVILVNLGGPDSPQAVRPFLRNLFRDKAIIQAPFLIRFALAELISRSRNRAAQANYALMGGHSPLLAETQSQAAALQQALDSDADHQYRVFIAMRYWHPMSRAVAQEVTDWGADEAIILPLYPQFSTTTTASSFDEWCRHYEGRSSLICCYPELPGFTDTIVGKIIETWEEAGRPEPVRLLFSAHGLPEKIIAAGDPYADQIERSVAIIGRTLPQHWEKIVCYQSRVGPLRWIGPSTEAEIGRAARDKKHILVVPIAFVSEHIETLVELDIEYRHLAEKLGALSFHRVATVRCSDLFIKALAAMVRSHQQTGLACAPGRADIGNAPAICAVTRAKCRFRPLSPI